MRITSLMLRSVLVAVLFVVLVLPGVPVHAQQPAPTKPVTPAAATPAPTAAPTAAGQPAKTSESLGDKIKDGAAAVGDIGSCAKDFGNCLLNAVGNAVGGFANFILALSGVLLNFVIVKTVFQFSTLVGNSQGLLTSWGILRDLGNLVLLFGFVLMGLGTILDTNKLPDKKAIPMLIVFAVLLNFSLFAAEAVIDTSNVLTSAIYAQANTNPCYSEACDINVGLGGTIMEATGLSTLNNVPTDSYSKKANKLSIIFGLAAFAIIGSVVLFAAAIMLAFRAVTLTGLIIISPIGFAGMAIPPLKKYATQWWNALIHQAFFAPLLFLFILITLKVTEGFAAGTTNKGLASALLAQGTSEMGIIMVFMLIIGGLVASLMAAKKFGAMGADYAINTAGKVVGGATFGTAGFVGRRTIGAGSLAAARTIRSQSWGATGAGRILAGVADRGGKASYDFRKTKIAAQASKKTKIDFGTPGKTASGGFAAIEKKDIDKKTAYAKSLEMSESQKIEKEKLGAAKETAAGEQAVSVVDTNTRRAAAEATKKQIKDTWAPREQQLNTEIAALESKAVANAGGAEVSRLDTEIAIEKLKAQRFQATGQTTEWMDAENKVKALQKQRAEFVDVETKLNALRDAKTTELSQYEAQIAVVDGDLASISAESAASETAYKAKLDGIDKRLKEIDPKTKQEKYAEGLKNDWYGGYSSREAARKIKTDNKKKSPEKALLEAIKALEANTPPPAAPPAPGSPPPPPTPPTP
ncbi:MAG: hypothetical protein AB203_03855 [Parcubacteria bacterium C7867-008]|nr:MAG: hypothetical protein AB203_03855 [Parcubacteria bacterium C7867-008]